jgi:NAD(P)-dependent dehydrogenase (short-subunit alcohol dehydrogenase family)
MARSLVGKVAVVTGASSGIGRATALEFARQGAHVVVAARAAAPLREVADACEARGARARAVEVDVADEDAVERLATIARDTFGRLDVWVNDAGVYAFARFEDTPPELFRRVLETNLMGTVNGARAALARFRAQGSGVLVNVASMEGKVTAPYSTAYSASKHGVMGFSSALRQELRLEGASGIHVCVVLPGSIDTPLFQHAANYSGWKLKAMSPVYPAERVARAIVRLARHPRREVFVGGSARLFAALWTIAPSFTEALLARMVDHNHLLKHQPQTGSPGNAFAPARPQAISGGWRPSGGARARRMFVAAAIAAPAIWAVRRAL